MSAVDTGRSQKINKTEGTDFMEERINELTIEMEENPVEIPL